MKRRANKLITVAIIAGIVAMMWLGGFCFFCYNINHYPQPDATKTDAIIALTGGRNRITKAIELYNMGWADKLFVSGVSQNVGVEDIAAKAKIKILNPQGVELGYEATNTIENAEEIEKWILKSNIRSIRLITSNYHLPRSLAELSAYNLALEIVIHPVYSEKVPPKWWKSWATFSFVFAEYNKYLFVCLRNLLRRL